MLLLLFVVACLSPALAKPQEQAAAPPQAQHDGQQSTPIPIVNSASEVGADGSFNYSYETGNGIHYQQSAYTKTVPASGDQPDSAGKEQVIQVMTGSFSYPAPDGTIINLTYVADENGFQPQGEHLPTPPPIPESIQKVLEMLPQIQNEMDHAAAAATPPQQQQQQQK